MPNKLPFKVSDPVKVLDLANLLPCVAAKSANFSPVKPFFFLAFVFL